MSNIWCNNLKKLIQFKADYGHTNVPKSYADQQLARLVITLRQQKRLSSLKAERELALHQIGFNFEPLHTQWLEVFNKLVEFYRLSGHASPNRRSENKHERALADWVHRMHKLIRNNELSEEKVKKLKLVNVDGCPSNHKISRNGLPANFEKMLARLQAYILKYSSVIHRELADPKLYNWVLLQQSRIKISLITPKEYTSLIKTGFSINQDITVPLQEAINYE